MELEGAPPTWPDALPPVACRWDWHTPKYRLRLSNIAQGRHSYKYVGDDQMCMREMQRIDDAAGQSNQSFNACITQQGDFVS